MAPGPPGPELKPRGHRANRQCIFRAGNPVSRHLMVHLKGKGNRHSWPDKVAVLHAWCRQGRSLGSCLSTGANDRPHCSIGREFTVNSPELLRSGRLGVLTPGLASEDTRCATTISRHRQQSARCVGDSQGRTQNDPVAVSS